MSLQLKLHAYGVGCMHACMQVGLVHAGMAGDAVRLMAPTGALLSMRYELRYPFAQWLAQQAVEAAGRGEGGTHMLHVTCIPLMPCA